MNVRRGRWWHMAQFSWHHDGFGEIGSKLIKSIKCITPFFISHASSLPLFWSINFNKGWSPKHNRTKYAKMQMQKTKCKSHADVFLVVARVISILRFDFFFFSTREGFLVLLHRNHLQFPFQIPLFHVSWLLIFFWEALCDEQR